jgi:hypothetical protein
VSDVAQAALSEMDKAMVYAYDWWRDLAKQSSSARTTMNGQFPGTAGVSVELLARISKTLADSSAYQDDIDLSRLVRSLINEFEALIRVRLAE